MAQRTYKNNGTDEGNEGGRKSSRRWRKQRKDKGKWEGKSKERTACASDVWDLKISQLATESDDVFSGHRPWQYGMNLQSFGPSTAPSSRRAPLRCGWLTERIVVHACLVMVQRQSRAVGDSLHTETADRPRRSHLLQLDVCLTSQIV